MGAQPVFIHVEAEAMGPQEPGTYSAQSHLPHFGGLNNSGEKCSISVESNDATTRQLQANRAFSEVRLAEILN